MHKSAMEQKYQQLQYLRGCIYNLESSCFKPGAIS